MKTLRGPWIFFAIFLLVIAWWIGVFKADPKPSQQWVMDSKSRNPFTRAEWIVAVDEVKEGWVSYHFVVCGAKLSRSIRTFKLVYSLDKP